MRYAKMHNDELLALVQRAVSSTLANPKMFDAVVPFGYSVERFRATQAGIDEYQEAVRYKQELDGRQRTATQQLTQAADEFHARSYRPHLAVVQNVFKRDAGFLTRVGSVVRRQKRFNPWLQGIIRFYDALLADPELVSRMGEEGIPLEVLQASRARILEIQALDQAQEVLKATSQQATLDRQKKREPIADWLWQYRQICRAAWRDHPEWLEVLGLKVPSGPRSKKKTDGEPILMPEAALA
jgi:hypothetical protein